MCNFDIISTSNKHWEICKNTPTFVFKCFFYINFSTVCHCIDEFSMNFQCIKWFSTLNKHQNLIFFNVQISSLFNIEKVLKNKCQSIFVIQHQLNIDLSMFSYWAMKNQTLKNGMFNRHQKIDFAYWFLS